MWISQNIRYRPLFSEAFIRRGSAGTAFAPYGFASRAPDGLSSVAVSCENGDVTIGYEMPSRSLEVGEVALYSLGGASIVLKNDGSVVINGLTITADGEIV